jgi:hypothetical protein
VKLRNILHTYFQEFLIVLCLVVTVTLAYPTESEKSVEEQPSDLEGAESRGFSLGHLGIGHGGFGRAFNFGGSGHGKNVI